MYIAETQARVDISTLVMVRDLVGFLPIGGQCRVVKFRIRPLNSLVNSHWSQCTERVLVFYRFQDGVYPWIYTRNEMDLLTQTPFSSLEGAVWTRVPAPGGEISLEARQLTFLNLPGFNGIRAVEFEIIDTLDGMYLRRDIAPQNLSFVRQDDGSWNAVLRTDADPEAEVVGGVDSLRNTIWRRVRVEGKKSKRRGQDQVTAL